MIAPCKTHSAGGKAAHYNFYLKELGRKPRTVISKQLLSKRIGKKAAHCHIKTTFIEKNWEESHALSYQNNFYRKELGRKPRTVISKQLLSKRIGKKAAHCHIKTTFIEKNWEESRARLS
ncbi:hypothetical protein [Acinetobacter rudis]|uniref:hypothetical protein n=1 Tax=Acinetobacter rudis TaxID=632955 RepID=UPI003340E94E